MTTAAKPTQTRVAPIAAHVYTLPVVREVPLPLPPGCWDTTW